jgi:GNAT superfamily N-acetyltransferase
MNISPRRIEEASLNAWPAIHQIHYDGWILRFSMGYTKRANSVNLVYPSTLDLGQKIEACEQIFSQQGLPPVFRLTPLALDELDAVLAERGYQRIDTTWLMLLDLEKWDRSSFQEIELREMPLDQWMGVFSAVSGSVVGRQPGHAEILQNILNPHLMAALEKSGQWLSCGLGVLERDLFGLFDIVTHADFRNRGFGTALIAGMLNWAKSRGAKVSYLQVMENNSPARRLYSRLGYKDAYSYWYRVPADFVK